MKQGKSASDSLSTAKDRATAEIPSAPEAARNAPKRQLKDYPQSLQTAARALWG
jgi:hypothetical protein